MSNSNPSHDVSVYARAGGNMTVANHGGAVIAARARQGFRARFEHQVDPDGVLPVAERARRVEAAMRAHMAMMTAKSAASRAAKKAAKTADAATSTKRIRYTSTGIPIDCAGCARDEGRAYIPGATDRVCAKHLDEMRRQIRTIRQHIDRTETNPFTAA